MSEAAPRTSRTEQQAYYETTFQPVETFWGPQVVGVSAPQLLAQRLFIERQEQLREERRVLEARSKAIQAELDALTYQCIHVTPSGESSVDGGIYNTCRYCGDSW